MITRVIILDDNPSDAELAKIALKNLKEVECTLVKTFAEFKTKMSELEFSAVLSDYNLSEFLGTDVLEFVLEKYPEIPFIMISGALGEQKAVDILKQGATDYVLKDNLQKLPLSLSRALLEASNKRAEIEATRKLRESEEKYRSVVDDQTEYIVRWKPDGTILFANKSYLDFVELTESELLKKNYFSLIPKAEKDRFSDKIASLTIDSPVSIDSHQSSRGKQGMFWHEWVDRAFFDKDEIREYQSVGRDITLHKRAEFKIRRNEEFKESILSALFSSIGVIDKNGLIISTNKKWEDFAQSDNVTLIKTGVGSNYIDACNNSIKNGDKLASRALAGIRSILSSNEDLFELEYNCDWENEKKWFQIRVTPLIGDNRGAVIAHSDVTNQKVQQQQIVESEMRYRSLFEKMHEGLFVSSTSGKITMVNRQFVKMIGYSESELLGENSQLILGKNETDQTVQEFAESNEVRMIKKNGESIYVNLSTSPLYDGEGKFDGTMSIVSDITERKSAEKKLNISYSEIKTFEKISNAVIQGKSVPEISAIILKGLSYYSGVTASRLYMIEGEIQSPEMITELFDETFRTRLKAMKGLKLIGINEDISEESGLMSILKEKVPLITSEPEKIRELITSYSTNINFQNIRSILKNDLDINTIGVLPVVSNDVIVGIIVFTSFDILEDIEKQSIVRFSQHAGAALGKRKTEEELSRYKVNLENIVAERTNKLNELNQELEAFNYSVSHDLRTPVRAIDIYRGLLAEELQDSKLIKYVNQIEKCTLEMNELIKSLLEFSKMTNAPITIEAVNLTDMVTRCFEKQKMHENVPSAVLKLEQLPVVLADNKLLNIVINNLLSNAVKYSSHREEPLIEVGSTDSEKNYIIYVKDNGVGFNSKLSSKLFKPFSRLHHGNQFKGTGAGLAMVDRILRRHNGKIYAESAVDKGAIFYFTLPKQFDHLLK
jgi:PAS domain S-box-containing protein